MCHSVFEKTENIAFSSNRCKSIVLVDTTAKEAGSVLSQLVYSFGIACARYVIAACQFMAISLVV